MKYFTTAAVLAVGLNAGAVMAAESGEAADRLLEELDRNNDEVVSMDEARTSFDRADIDGDDELSKAEIEQAMAETDVSESEEVTESELEGELAEEDTTGDQLLVDLDTNEDGVLSREEATGHPQLDRTFDQVDTDGDGELGPAELAEVTGGPGGPGGADGGAGGAGAAGGSDGGSGSGSGSS